MSFNISNVTVLISTNLQKMACISNRIFDLMLKIANLKHLERPVVAFGIVPFIITAGRDFVPACRFFIEGSTISVKT